MAALNITVHVKESKRNELFGTCLLVTEQTRKFEGCLECSVSEGSDDKNVIVIEQQWAKEKFIVDYFRSNHFQALLGAMKWLGRTYEIQIDGGPYEEKIKEN